MSTDRDREGEKLVISGGVWRSGKKTEQEKNRLITELADALDNGPTYSDGPQELRSKFKRNQVLIKRAREATDGR